MIYRALKGMKDILPTQSHIWRWMEEMMRHTADLYGYREIRTPILESTDLFLRGVGTTTDIVQKEMYTFSDKGDRSITLKPEGTAGVVRAFIEHALTGEPQPVKMYYLYTPVHRYERPQGGRLREHHQFGVEVFGAPSAQTDAEIIALAMTVLRRLGIGDLSVNINSIGCETCRPAYNQALKGYFVRYLDDMCLLCKERYDRNPLRLLDCKEDRCRRIAISAPSILEYLCDECSDHFATLKDELSSINIAYQIDPTIVRGLDYYTKTVFEIISTRRGSQGTVCGGGRYDKLMEICGGPDLPGVGFGMGMERLELILEQYGAIPKEPPSRCDAFAIVIESASESLHLAMTLRNAGISADYDPLSRSLKAQMRYAEKMKAKMVLIVGDEERRNGTILVRNMNTHEQREVTYDMIVTAIAHDVKGEKNV